MRKLKQNKVKQIKIDKDKKNIKGMGKKERDESVFFLANLS